MLELTDQIKKEAAHLRLEANAQYGADRIAFVGINTDGFVLAFVVKRDLYAHNRGNGFKSWYGKPVTAIFAGKILPAA